MIKIDKEIFKKALLAGIFSTFTIGVLTVLTYKTALGLFIAGSFGSSMVLLFGFPESPFAQPKNVFFGHLITALVGVIFVHYIPLPMLTYFKSIGLDIKDFPSSYNLYKNEISLPIYNNLSLDSVEHVCEKLIKIVNEILE